MNFIPSRHTEPPAESSPWSVTLLDQSDAETAAEIDRLQASGWTLHDTGPYVVEEVQEIARLPAGSSVAATSSIVAQAFDEAHAWDDLPSEFAVYAVMPWRRSIARIPVRPLWRVLHTSRNRHLLTMDEIEQWADSSIAIAGLSVGSAALQACVLSGATQFSIADTDVLSVSNLNRLPRSVCDVGRSKVELACFSSAELNPYVSFSIYDHGVTTQSAGDFVAPGGEPVSVVIEEIDDVSSKVGLRVIARDLGVPVVSATDMGNNVVLDVERYDLDRDYPIFHGLVDGLAGVDLHDPTTKARAAFAIVGGSATQDMLFSATEIGRSLTSWPQLGTTAMASGSLAATAARHICLGRSLESGRYVLDIDFTLLGRQSELRPNELSHDDFADRLKANAQQ